VAWLQTESSEAAHLNAEEPFWPNRRQPSLLPAVSDRPLSGSSSSLQKATQHKISLIRSHFIHQFLQQRDPDAKAFHSKFYHFTSNFKEFNDNSFQAFASGRLFFKEKG
jgi:hypothetical protein